MNVTVKDRTLTISVRSRVSRPEGLIWTSFSTEKTTLKVVFPLSSEELDLPFTALQKLFASEIGAIKDVCIQDYGHDFITEYSKEYLPTMRSITYTLLIRLPVYANENELESKVVEALQFLSK